MIISPIVVSKSQHLCERTMAETSADISTDSTSTPASLHNNNNITSNNNPKRKANTMLPRRNSLTRALSTRGDVTSTNNDDAVSVISDLDDNLGNVLDDEAREVRGLARKETFKVQILRLIVAICIVGAGIVISLFTYRYLNEEEERESKQNFNLLGASIEETVQRRFQNLADASLSCARLITSEAVANTWEFPFVTMSSFELYAQQARASADMEAIMYLPVVPNGSLQRFNDYMASNENWVTSSRLLERTMLEQPRGTDSNAQAPISYGTFEFVDSLFDIAADGTRVETQEANGPYWPVWQWSPPPQGGSSVATANFPIGKENFASLADESMLIRASEQSRDMALGKMSLENEGVAVRLIGTTRHNAAHIGPATNRTPHALFARPITSTLASSSAIVGYLVGIVALESYLYNLLPPNAGVEDLVIVAKNSCGDEHTFLLEEERAVYLGFGDLSSSTYRGEGRTFGVYDRPSSSTTGSIDGHCSYSFSLYPTSNFKEDFTSDKTRLYTILVVLIFAVMAFAFFIYDFIVQRRNSLVLQTAAKFNTIVSSLFPSNIRGRLFADKERNYIDYTTAKSHLKNFLTKGDIDNLDDEDDDGLILKTKPMADLFTDTTIMFADIAGFTAWSSVREPSQVFILLETVYRSFDQIAKKRRVFKVETVGDCYVAVAGLPDPREDHAVVMARFARECLAQMNVLVKKLEVNLGPDTGDLGLRIGLHSGPVTAGVLRGERSRFQLFGDTMNTTARMESTGFRDRIQMSQETANLLSVAGKKHWYEAREDTVVAKGKGAMNTFWLRTQENLEKRKRPSLPAEFRESVIEKASLDKLASEKTARLIDWNCDVLLRLLKQIVARRRMMAKMKMNIMSLSTNKSTRRQSMNTSFHGGGVDESNENGTVIDEVKEIITLPKLDLKLAKAQEEADSIDLNETVVNELSEYVSNIAAMYRDNHFHNFEHASHVTMSVVKLLSRIVAPSDLLDEEVDKKKKGTRVSISVLHDHTYGITSDPLTQFACVLSALIHDADHPGVPNAQLVKEQTRIAVYYKNQSVAEQNSVDLCWDLLMDPKFRNLRETIYSNDVERARFRQLVVNSVMATDIVDKELKALRNARWDKAFKEAPSIDDAEDIESNVNRKATIVIEHLIQASDVAHTMQHWHIYRKWNERFFMECYKGYKDGRAASDPSENWYKGELGFFDFYIIPLAKKLKDCGVFGVSSDEYLNYAQKNREEWEARGKEIVAAMIEKVQKSAVVDGLAGSSSPRRISFDSTDDETAN